MNLKSKAIKLRKQGYSYSEIIKKLKIPKSTLSGWVKEIQLNNSQKLKIKRRWLKKLEKAREKAAKTHRKNKKERLKKIDKKAERFVNNLHLNNQLYKVFLAALYLGDGIKREGSVELGSSNPKIAKAFVLLLRKLYRLDESRLKCTVFARYDQIPEKLEKYWSKLLKIPRSQFYKTYLDKRTAGSKTYSQYKGVCLIRYTESAMQREIISIGNFLLEKIVQES